MKADVAGRYCEDCSVAVPVSDGSMANYDIRLYASADLARRLWSMSEKMVGEVF